MPQAIAMFVFQVATDIGISVGVAATVAGIASIVIPLAALGLVANLLAPGRPSIPKPSDGKVSQKQTIPPRVRGGGRARLGGSYMLYEAAGSTSVDVLALHDGVIDGFEDFYLHDDPVTLTLATSSPPGGTVNAGADGRYSQSAVVVETRFGLATEGAYSDVIAKIGDAAVWDTDCRGDGIASATLICNSVASKDFQTVYPNGLPMLSITCRLQPIYDPRDGGQSASTASTWKFTRTGPVEQGTNPPLFLMHYLRQELGFAYSTFSPVIADWQQAANDCDDAISLKAGGTERRYRFGGVYQVNNDPADVIATLLATFDGYVSETGTGALTCKAGKYTAPTVTIGADHVIDYSVQRFTPDESAVNELIGTYTSPLHQYTEVQADPWEDTADQIARGQVRPQPVDLLWVQSHAQARRLLKREMLRQSADARGTVRTTLYGLNVLGQRYIYLDLPDMPSLAGMVAEVRSVQVDLAGASIVINWIRADPEMDDWTPSLEEGTAPPLLDALPSAPLPSPTTFTPTGVAGPHIQVVVDNPGRTDLFLAVLYRLHAGGAWITEEFHVLDFSHPTVTVITSAVLAALTSYDVQAAWVGPGGAYSAFVGPTTITTP